MDKQYYWFFGIRFPLYGEPLKQKVFLHALFWLVFLASHLSYFVPAFRHELLSGPLRISYAIYYLRLIPIFYCYTWIFNRLQSRVRPIFLFALSLLSAFILTHVITLLMYMYLDYEFGLANLSPAFLSIGQLYLHSAGFKNASDYLVLIHDQQDMQLLILPLGLKMAKFGERQSALKNQIENYQLHTELKDLRASLAPHLVFNVINAAYYEIREVSKEASFYLAKLADMLRYSVYETQRPSISLQKELDCIKSYLELEQLRRGFCPKISFAQQGTVEPGYKIPTMLLLTLTENAFKHSVGSPLDDNWIDISLSVSRKGMIFKISNSKPEKKKVSRPEEYSGLGLMHIEKMLQQHFPGRHSLRIIDQPTRFELSVSLPFVP